MVDEDKIRLKIESNKKKPKKKSKFQQKMEEISKQQQKKRRWKIGIIFVIWIKIKLICISKFFKNV